MNIFMIKKMVLIQVLLLTLLLSAQAEPLGVNGASSDADRIALATKLKNSKFPGTYSIVTRKGEGATRSCPDEVKISVDDFYVRDGAHWSMEIAKAGCESTKSAFGPEIDCRNLSLHELSASSTIYTLYPLPGIYSRKWAYFFGLDPERFQEEWITGIEDRSVLDPDVIYYLETDMSIPWQILGLGKYNKCVYKRKH